MNNVQGSGQGVSKQREHVSNNARQAKYNIMSTVDDVVLVTERVYSTILVSHSCFYVHTVSNLDSSNVVSHLNRGFTPFGKRFQNLPMSAMVILTHVGRM